MKKYLVIAIVCVLAITGTIIAKINYDNTHWTGYVYKQIWPLGRDRDFSEWVITKEKSDYTLDEIRELADGNRVAFTGVLYSGTPGVGIRTNDDTAIVFPGLDWTLTGVKEWYLTL